MTDHIPPLRTWLFETVLPFWADRGIDWDKGGFVERLSLDRTPAPDDYKRVRVQARQIYTFTHARVLGAPDWTLKAARHGVDFMTETGWDAQTGGWYTTVTRSGRPLERRRDAYTHVFILLAMAWLYRATGEPGALEWARRTIDFLDDRLADPVQGGYQESWDETDTPGTWPLPRRQNPHMHLLEALLALHEATGDRGWLDRAGGIVDLFQRFFFDRETGTVGEFFTTDWQPAPNPDGARREPGHSFEWVWLLHQYRRLSGDDGVVEPALRLYRSGMAQGVDRAPGMVRAPFDEIDRSGAVLNATKRLWPQTEAIKACLAVHEMGPQDGGQADEAQALADAHLKSLFQDFLHVEHGVWRDQLDREGRELSDTIPASTLYHLFVCLTEAMRVLGR
ncbi:MAG: AGE family epimerase/isomerase [Inquilinaceae bacterium]